MRLYQISAAVLMLCMRTVSTGACLPRRFRTAQNGISSPRLPLCSTSHGELGRDDAASLIEREPPGARRVVARCCGTDDGSIDPDGCVNSALRLAFRPQAGIEPGIVDHSYAPLRR
jgi:hypothetical protein